MSLKESGLIGLPVFLRDKGSLSKGSCHEETEGMIILSLDALQSSGATLDPDTDRPLMALTFRLESGDVSLTLYAFDTESVLADVNGEIGLLVQREDAENIVDLVLEMLKTE